MQKIDILGASAATLSMIFELLRSQKIQEKHTLRIIKNTNHLLDYPFEIAGLSYQILEKEEVKDLHQDLFLGVYKAPTKKIVYQYFKEKYNILNAQFVNLIHHYTAIAETVQLGNGIQVNPMSTIAPYTQIGDFVSINRHVSIGHHCKIASFCTINPNVHIAGHCALEEGVTVGMGALILDGKSIGKNSIIGAGALVTKDVPESVLVMGSPAKIVKSI